MVGRRSLANAVRRRIAALLREAGWSVSDGRIGRLGWREGLKVPKKQPGRGGLWFYDGSCIRLRPERRSHVRSHARPDRRRFLRTSRFRRFADSLSAFGNGVADVGAATHSDRIAP